MKVLSASEAITPAINRTKAILFQPFRKGRSWKLAATAYASAMGLAFIPTPLIFLAFSRPHGTEGGPFGTLVLAIAALVTAMMLLFFYLGSRLQFVLFAIASEKREMVAPLWARYGSRTWRWIGLKLILSFAVCAIFAVPLAYRFTSLIQNLAIQPGQPPSPQMFANILLLYFFILTPILFLMLCSSLLSDFVLPPIALEDATILDAAGRFLQLIKDEPLQVLAYTLFKILFAIAGVMAMQIVVFVVEIVALIPLGLLAFLGWLAFHALGLAGHLLMVAGGITLVLIFFVALFYVIIGLLGCVHMFYQTYAIYFLGGQYPLLGDMLEPPLAPMPSPPPMPDSPPLLEPAL